MAKSKTQPISEKFPETIYITFDEDESAGNAENGYNLCSRTWEETVPCTDKRVQVATYKRVVVNEVRRGAPEILNEIG